MTIDDFFFIFEGQIERLDKFFHKRLLRARIYEDLEDQKTELIHETAIAVCEKLKEDAYQSYDTFKLIGLKAKDVWMVYLRKWYKHHQMFTGKIPEDLIESLSDENLIKQLEARDELDHLKDFGSPASWDMLMMHLDGKKYTEIANYFRLSEGSVKMKISRLRKILPRR